MNTNMEEDQLLVNSNDQDTLEYKYLGIIPEEVANKVLMLESRLKKLRNKQNQIWQQIVQADTNLKKFIIPEYQYDEWRELTYRTWEGQEEVPPIPSCVSLKNILDSPPFKAPGLSGCYNSSGLKWSELSIPLIDETGELSKYNALLKHISKTFDLFNDLTELKEITIVDSSAIEHELVRTTLKIGVANELISTLNKVLGALVDDDLPDYQPTRQTNFVKDNKVPAPDDDHIKREQLPLSMAEDLADTLDLTDKEMAIILTISVRTYHRLKQKGLLNPVASERLLMLKDLAEYGLEVFEDQGNFNEWLRSPLTALSNKSPLSLLDTATGIAHVKTILGRIDYGVFS